MSDSPISSPSPTSPRSFASFREITEFIWQNAERLRGAYKPNEYDKVIVPLIVIRRLECVLAPTKHKVLSRLDELTARGVKSRDPAADLVLRKATANRDHPRGLPFYNISKLDLVQIKNEQSHSIAKKLRSYLKGFSANAQEVIENFKFDEQIGRLEASGLLSQVVGLFADVNLHPDAVANHVMGSIFEELIRRFNEKKNEEAGDHYTPREIIRLMVDLLFIEDDDALRKPNILRSLFDPACGTGGMLSVAEEYLHELNPDARLDVFGQEINPESYAICKADMLIKGQNPEHIVRGNSFSEDGHSGRMFDYMLSNPPFGVDWRNVQTFVEDEHLKRHAGRFSAGLPRINDGALLFLQHMISKMKPVAKNGEGGSRIALVLNGSPLFTGDAGSGESEIRRWILENDWLEAIVALPDQLFYNTGISTYIWVLTNRKPEHRKTKVQLINATDLYQKMRRSMGNKRNTLSQEHINLIVQTFAEFSEGEISKIFDNADFGYRRIIIERPLRLNFQATPERIERLQEEVAFQKLGKPKGGTSAHGDATKGAALQRSIVEALQRIDPAVSYRNRAEFERALATVLEASKISVSPSIKKAILSALSVRDESADICLDSNGWPESDPEMRDYESVPLKEDVFAYFEREIRPHMPDAWIAGVNLENGRAVVADPEKVRVGYEIPISRHFYKDRPLRAIEEIEADIRHIEREIQGLLAEVLR